MRRCSFIALCGPAGSGKHTLLQQAFSQYNISVLRLESQLNGANAGIFARKLQSTLGENGDVLRTIWAVGPAELLTQPAIATLRETSLSRRQQVVLVSCSKVKGVAKDATIYHNGLDEDARIRLARSLGASPISKVRDIVKACGADLRQLLMAATFGSAGTDAAAHVWMDTRAILSGAERPAEYYNADYLEHNVLDRIAPSRLEGAAAFYDSLALMDSLGNDLGDADLGGRIFKHGIAVHKLTQFRKSVLAPPPRLPQSWRNPRKWQKEMHAIHGNGATGEEAMKASRAACTSNGSEDEPCQKKQRQEETADGPAAACLEEPEASEFSAIAVGPRDLPGAQISLGIDPPLAVNATSSELGPPAPARVEPVVKEPEEQGADVLKKEGRVDIVPCEEKHLNAGVVCESNFLGIKAGEFRNRKVAAVRSNLPAERLLEWVRQHVARYCVVRVGAGSEALLFDTPKSRVKAPANSHAGVPTDKALAPVLASMLKNTEAFSTVELRENQRETYTREEIMEIARPYVGLNRSEFEAELISLATRDPASLTSEQRFLLANEMRMKSLRGAMVELELAKSYLTSLDDESLLHISKFQGLEKLTASRMRNGKKARMSFLLAVTEYLETATFVICGGNRLGKTPLCRAVAAMYAKARGVSYFAQSSTVDSLRMLSVQGFFKPHTAVVLDEWRIGKDSQDAQGHKVDFIKCLTDVENPGAVRLRYSDVRFAPSMPRLISSQQTMAEWIEALEDVAESDRDAIMKRLIFVDVTEPLVPAAMAAARQRDRGLDLKEAFMRVGLRAPTDGTIGGWVDA